MNTAQNDRIRDTLSCPDSQKLPPSALRERILEQDKYLRAWIHVADASLVDEAPATGILACVAFGVKDVIDVAGIPTGCGSAAADPRSVVFDAACVSQLRHAGAIPIG